MNILLVDNGTSYLSDLQKLLYPAKITTVPFGDISIRITSNYDLIVLSGGHKYTVISHKNRYTKELALIAKTKTPTIGICLGFELIVIAFGGRLKLLRRKVNRNVAITFTAPDTIAPKSKTANVFENHQRGVKRLPKSLKPLALSANGVEIIRHVDLPIYGFQFHPEKGRDDQGSIIIKKAINSMVLATET